jgi:N-carbamoyl-L-amino-acid hydrolase
MPNVTNAIPERVRAWLDARGPDSDRVEAMVASLVRQAQERALRDGTSVDIVAESVSPTVDFDVPLSLRVAAVLNDAPLIPTGAGHDAAILQLAGIPSAMVYVRNPTGISHAPEERAETEDCLAGVDALTKVLAELAA